MAINFDLWCQTQKAERESVRRKLARFEEEEEEDDDENTNCSNNNINERTNNGRHGFIQLEENNNIAHKTGDNFESRSVIAHFRHLQLRRRKSPTVTQKSKMAASRCSSNSDSDDDDDDEDVDCDFDETRLLLPESDIHREATIALQQAESLAAVQLEAERQSLTDERSKDFSSDVQSLINCRRSLSRDTLDVLNNSALQLIVNDLLSRIKEHNNNLMRLLMDRDELYMQQDALLIDIKDIYKQFSCDGIKTS